MSLRLVSATTTLALVAGGVAITAVPAAAAPAKGSISGVIYSEGDEDASSIGSDGVAVLGKWSAAGKYYEYTTEADADATGAYEFTGVAAGRYSVRFATTSGRWISETWDDVEIDTPVLPTAINLAAGQNYVASPELAQSATISGVVTGSESEDAELDWAIVSAYDAETGLSAGWSSIQDPDDELAGFVVSYLAPGTYNLYVESSGSDDHVSEWYGGSSVDTATDLTVAAGDERSDIDFELALGGGISGTASTSTTGEFGIRATAYNVDGDIVATGDVSDGVYEIAKLPVGSYRVGFESAPRASDKVIPEFWNDATTLEIAQAVDVVAGASVTGIDTELEAAMRFIATPRPTISGSAIVGSTLTAKAGTWKPDGVELSYEWFVSGVSAGTDPTFVVPSAAVGARIYLEVTGKREGYGTSIIASKNTAVVTKGVITGVTPKFTGTAKVGSTLTAVAGVWKPASTELSYQWLRSGKAIADATSPTYTLVSADRGKKIALKVTGTSAGFTSVSKTSAAKLVSYGLLVPGAVWITGTPKVGEILTAHGDPWGPGSVDLTYTWKADKKVIPGEKGATLEIPGEVWWSTITVTVTGKKPGYATASRTSAPTPSIETSIVAWGNRPTIVGGGAVGDTLTTSATGWAPKVNLYFNWTRGGVKIKGATKSTYKIQAQDRGHSIAVYLVAYRDGYLARESSSEDRRYIAPKVTTIDMTSVKTSTSSDVLVERYLTAPRKVAVVAGESIQILGEEGRFQFWDTKARLRWCEKSLKTCGTAATEFSGSIWGNAVYPEVPSASKLAAYKKKAKAGGVFFLEVIDVPEPGVRREYSIQITF
jgi:hypothetical protein